ncbi:MAG: hypothetical protein IT449_08750 [Phycisphaerales bacterium]|nr:hypothetical protein [Phycisphaerales bacterium]
MTDSPAAGHTAFTGVAIEHDTPCRRCGYNLRGLTVEGRCPECGTPVGLSAYGDFLRYCDPRWLERLATGVSFILWGILVGIVIGMAGGLLAALVHPVLGQGLMLCGGLVSLYGTWLLTEPDPSGIGEHKDINARRVVRVCLILGLGYNVLSMTARQSSTGGILFVFLVIGTALTGVSQAIGEAAKLLYLRKLALRIPDEALARRARFLVYAMGISLLLTIIPVVALLALGSIAAVRGPAAGMTVGPVTTRTVTLGGTTTTTAATTGIPAAGFMVAGCGAGLFGLAVLVFSVMSLHLVWRMGKAFREHGAYAGAIWAQQQQSMPPPGETSHA